LGDQLEALVDRIVTGRRKDVTAGDLDTGVSTVPVLHKDATDRNRTSPFAFTGNRFEFRMVGSSDNVATSTTALNTIMAEAFCDAADALEGAVDFEAACSAYIKELLRKHRRVIFNGDGYTDAWVAEAERRGLPIIRSTVDAISTLTSPETVETYGKFGVFTQTELASREEIRYEVYAKKIAVESRVMIHMAGKQYIPSVINYASTLADAVASSEAVGMDASVQREILNEITYLLRKAQDALNHLKEVYRETDAMTDLHKMAQTYRHVVLPAMDALRAPIDQLEMVVDSDFWPVPSYGDLMYNV
jgi:glutamine synthetase